MWIFLSILGVILLVLIIALLLPISVLIKGGKEEDFTLLIKIPFKTFNLTKDDKETENSNKIKKLLGVSKFEEGNVKKAEFLSLIRDKISLVFSLLKRLFELLGKCTVKALKINIVCSEKDAAETAINYGICYAVISPLINFLHGSMKVKKRGEKINIFSDFDNGENFFDFEIILSVSFFHVAAAALRLIFDETKRTILKNEQKEKA